MRMSSSDFEDMLEAVDMQEWLSYESIDYRLARGSSGEQINIKTCPSCGKSDWKVYLNAESGLGNCFSGSCEKGTYNKFSFIREYLLEFGERPNVVSHIQEFVREMGWRPKRITSAAVEMDSEKLEIPKFYELPINGKNLKYLINRRVSVELAKYFSLGYINAGYFKKRIFIPIHDLDGSLVSFQARDITGEADKKYLFPKGFASTGKIVYNGHNAWHRKHLVMVEGVFDVIGAKMALDDDRQLREVGVIGSFGMNLSGAIDSGGDDQLSRIIKLKEKGLRSITIMWDPEKKALIKAIKAGEILKSLGLEVRIAKLPVGHDPGDAAPSVIRRAFIEALPLTQSNAMRLRLSP